MFENDPHVGRLAENAHVGQHTVIHQIVCAAAIATVFLAAKFTPLRSFDFTGDRGDDDISFQAHTRPLQRSDGIGVTDERALHVVNAEAVDETVFDYSVRFVSDTGQKFLLARVGGIHVSVEHQVLPAARASPTADHVGAAFFDFLPGDFEANVLQRRLHELRHLQFFAGRAGDVDQIGRQRNDFVFSNLGQNSLDQFRVESGLGVCCYAGHLDEFSVLSLIL